MINYRGSKTLVLLSLFCWILISKSIAEEVSDKIVAVVNNEVITQSDLDTMIAVIKAQSERDYDAEQLDETRKEILQQIIETKLIISEAKEIGIKVSEEEIEQQLDEMRQRFAAPEDFERILQQGSLSINEMRKSIKERLIAEKLIDYKIRRQIKVYPSEISAYYHAHKKEIVPSPTAHVFQIFIRIEDEDSQAPAYRQAKQISRRLKAGEDFGKVAKSLSQGPYAETGGDMGWISKGELTRELDEAVFKLKAGEISGVVCSSLGLHILKVAEVKPSRPLSLSESQGLIQEVLWSQKFQDTMFKYIEELKKDAYIDYK